MSKVFKIEIEGEDWNGHVQMKIMPYQDRLDLAKEVDEDENDMDKAKRLSALVKDAVVCLALEHSSGIKFESMTDLEFYKEGSDLIGKLIPILVQGAPLGNVLKLT